MASLVGRIGLSDIERLRAEVDQRRYALRAAIEELIAATGETYPPWAPHLSDTQLVNCRVLQSRYHILDYMPKGAVCAEIGTQAGNFALEILSRTSPLEFHIVDLHLELFEHRQKVADMTDVGQVVFHQGYSADVLAGFDDDYFDWIYIDADHSYKGFVSDLHLASLKLKSGGFIVCNDYTVWSPGEAEPYGILKGVHEFCVANNWEFVFIGLHGQGYHDVCIRQRIGQIGAR